MALEKAKKHVIVGLGEVLWDLLPDGKQLGGAPANFAYHAQALGATGAVASCVGDDELGREIRDRLTELGLDLRCLDTDTNHPTSTVPVELDDRGIPQFTIVEDVAWDFLSVTLALLELAEAADAVCFGSLAQRSAQSRETIGRFLENTRSDCLRVFDVNLRQSYYSESVVRDSLGHADVLKLNDDELPVITELLSLPAKESHTLTALLAGCGLQMVALTRGENGSRLVTPNGESEHAGAPCDRIADTVGAGDCFTAALVIGTLRGDPLDRINDRANRLAGYVCSQPGATPPMPRELVDA